jgi:cytochrome c553
MKNKVIQVIAAIFVLTSCQNGIKPDIYAKYIETGNQITTNSQAVLLSNVAAAIQQGGPSYAIEFCNLKASGITDSLSQVYKCAISRISAKNRNPENTLKTETDNIVWSTFQNGNLTDTLLQDRNKLVYYKAIKTAMPACLKCHGLPGTDIDSVTIAKLNNLYPADKATGYVLNDFRGLWKIEFQVN